MEGVWLCVCVPTGPSTVQGPPGRSLLLNEQGLGHSKAHGPSSVFALNKVHHLFFRAS